VATLLTKLFGDGNLNMLTRPFPEQAQLMNNILDLIDEDGLEDDLLALAGLKLLPTIRRVNVEYGKMVDRRTDGEAVSRTNLHLQRHGRGHDEAGQARDPRRGRGRPGAHGPGLQTPRGGSLTETFQLVSAITHRKPEPVRFAARNSRQPNRCASRPAFHAVAPRA
jgi:hypothetical protein